MANVEGKICNWQSIDAMTFEKFPGEPYDYELDQDVISAEEYTALDLQLAVALEERYDEFEFATAETKINRQTGELAFKITWASDNVTSFLLWSCIPDGDEYAPPPSSTTSDSGFGPEIKATIFNVVSGLAGAGIGYKVGVSLHKPIPVPAALIGGVLGLMGSIALTRSRTIRFAAINVQKMGRRRVASLPKCGSCR